MKTLSFKYLFLLFSIGVLISCSNDDDAPGKNPIEDETQLVLTAPATETTTGEEVTFEVTANGEAVNDAEIFIDGTPISGYSYVFEDAGEYQVVAKKEGYLDSKAVDIHVEEEIMRLVTYTRNGGVTTFSYNADTYLSNYNPGGSDVRNVIYDAENRVIHNWIFEYSYNNLGQITKMTEQDGGSTINKQATFIYNNDGRVAVSQNQFTSASTSETTRFTRQFEYDTDGRLVSLTEEELGATTVYRFLITYDGNDNISKIKWQHSSNDGPFTDFETYTYTYDDKKNPGYMLLNSMGISDRTSLVYVHEMGGHGHHLLGNYVYSRMNYYNPNNVLTYTDGANSWTYEYVYNEDGWPTAAEETINYSSGSTFMSYYSWEYKALAD